MIWPASAGRDRGTVPTERRAQAGPVMRAGTGPAGKRARWRQRASTCLYGRGVASRAWGSSVFRPIVSMKYQASLSQYQCSPPEPGTSLRCPVSVTFEGEGKGETGRYHHPAALVRITHAAPVIHDAVQAFADIVGAVVIMEGDDSW